MKSVPEHNIYLEGIVYFSRGAIKSKTSLGGNFVATNFYALSYKLVHKVVMSYMDTLFIL